MSQVINPYARFYLKVTATLLLTENKITCTADNQRL